MFEADVCLSFSITLITGGTGADPGDIRVTGLRLVYPRNN